MMSCLGKKILIKIRSYKKAPGRAIPLKDCSTYQLFNGALRSFAMTHHGGIYNNQGHSKTKMTKSGYMDDMMMMQVMTIIMMMMMTMMMLMMVNGAGADDGHLPDKRAVLRFSSSILPFSLPLPPP